MPAEPDPVRFGTARRWVTGVSSEAMDVSGGETNGMMKALVYGGPGQRAWQTKPRPVVRDPGDAVVRITTSTICGTDLHILPVARRRTVWCDDVD